MNKSCLYVAIRHKKNTEQDTGHRASFNLLVCGAGAQRVQISCWQPGEVASWGYWHSGNARARSQGPWLQGPRGLRGASQQLDEAGTSGWYGATTGANSRVSALGYDTHHFFLVLSNILWVWCTTLFIHLLKNIFVASNLSHYKYICSKYVHVCFYVGY